MSNRKRNFLWGGILCVVILGLLLLIETPIQEPHLTIPGTSAVAQIITDTPLPKPTMTTAPSITFTSTINPTATSTPEPAWVTDFADPILAAIKDREPDFQDDFSTDTKRWYPVSLGDFDFEKTLVIKDGMMHLEEAWGISNYYFVNKPNIVMQFDVQQPIEKMSIHPSFFFLQFNNIDTCKLFLLPGGRWEIQVNNEPHTAGNFSLVGQSTQITMMVYHTQIAYYINEMPVGYYDEPRLLDARNDDKRYINCSECAVDNVKVWNLDKIPDFP